MDNQLTYRLVLSYDGTDFSGWQIQPNGVSIQELIQKAIATLLREPISVVGSGRTDAGVHALAQVAHFRTSVAFDIGKFLASVNGMLPWSIRVFACEQVRSDFHACHSASGKEYHYHLTLDRVQSPFHRLYRWHIRRRIDTQILQAAADQFVGTHDFTSFANEAHKGSASKDPVRTLRRVDVKTEVDGVRIEFEGDGFLYKMVRNIVGTMIEVAACKTPLDHIITCLKAHDRRVAGHAAPAHGLFLVKVTYPEEYTCI